MKTIILIFSILFILVSLVSFLIVFDKIIKLEREVQTLKIKQDAIILQMSGGYEPVDMTFIKKIKRKDMKEK